MLRYAGTRLLGARDLLYSVQLAQVLPGLARRPLSPLDIPRRFDEVLCVDTEPAHPLAADGRPAHLAAQRLVARGLRVALLSPVPPAGDAGIEHLAFPAPDTSSWPLESSLPHHGRHVFEAGVRALRRRPRWLYQPISAFGTAGVLLARHLNVPLVLGYIPQGPTGSMSGLEVRAPWVAGLARRLEGICLREADLVVTEDPSCLATLRGLGIAPERVACRPDLVDACLEGLPRTCPG